MNATDLRSAVLSSLASIAPELDVASLKPDRPLRDQVDLDSYDWLQFLLLLHERLAVDIPEADYRKLDTLDALLSYLGARVRT